MPSGEMAVNTEVNYHVLCSWLCIIKCLLVAVMDPSTAKGMSSEYVAHQVMCAVAQRQRDVVLASAIQRAAVYLQLFYPALLDWILRRRTKVT